MTKTIDGLLRTLSLVGLAFLSTSALANISVTLSPSPAGPQPLATTITWTATVTDSSGGAHEFQFSVAPSGGPPAIVSDYSNVNSFQWTPSINEGTFTISVVARNISTGGTASASAPFTVIARLINGHAAVYPTSNPLVAFFTTASCQVPNFMRVRFTPTSTVPPGGITASMTTNLVSCRFLVGSKNPDNTSMNFYIAGMYPSTTYNMHWETLNPMGQTLHVGTDYPFTTGSLPSNLEFPTNIVTIPAGPPSSITAPILLHGYLPTGGSLPLVQSATDLSGNVLWYYPHPVGQLTRTEVGGKMLVLISRQTNLYNNVLHEIDLAGNITLATNVHRINEQLAQMTDPFTGMPRRPVNQFDHEIRRLSNGNIAVKASEEMLVTNKAQCGTDGSGNPKTCDVLGAQLLILNPNLQIIWAWDSFDFLDINRPANLKEVCHQGDSGCPVIFLAASANDWLHANSIQLTEDGSLLFSLRDQDWIIKINYANGTGDGSVLWRMGYQGDFTINDPPTSPLCTSPNQKQIYAWFSHQHDTNFEYGGQSVLTLFDNGNLRITRCDTGGSSRGYVLTVDEAGRTVIPVLIQDLGSYSVGLGTAEVIPGSSNYHFNNGFIQPGPFTRSQEITPEGTAAFEMDSEDILTYRSYRMQDLYTPAPPL